VREALARLGLPEVTGVLQNLLRERIPIRDLARILEVLARQAVRTKHPDLLSEKVRAALGRVVCQRLADAQGTLHLVELAPELDHELAQAYQLDEVGCELELPPARARAILDWVRDIHAEVWDDCSAPTGPVVLVASPQARPALARLVQGHFAHLAVLTWTEIPPGTELVVTSTAA
jgi:flagellar biosynthesis protein FlhA